MNEAANDVLLPLLNAAIKEYQARINEPGISRAKAKLTRAYVHRMEETRDMAVLGREVSHQIAEELTELGPWVVGPVLKTPQAPALLDDLSNLLTFTGHSWTETRRIRNEASLDDMRRPYALSIEQQFLAVRMFEEEKKEWMDIARNCVPVTVTHTAAPTVSGMKSNHFANY